jgi:hypothetical protein
LHAFIQALNRLPVTCASAPLAGGGLKPMSCMRVPPWTDAAAMVPARSPGIERMGGNPNANRLGAATGRRKAVGSAAGAAVQTLRSRRCAASYRQRDEHPSRHAVEIAEAADPTDLDRKQAR